MKSIYLFSLLLRDLLARDLLLRALLLRALLLRAHIVASLGAVLLALSTMTSFALTAESDHSSGSSIAKKIETPAETPPESVPESVHESAPESVDKYLEIDDTDQSDQSHVKEDQTWITSFELQGLQLREEIIVEERSNGLFVPLEDILAALEYQFELHPDGTKGTGWIGNKDRLISIDFKSSKFVNNGIQTSFSPEEALLQNDVLYVTTRLISQIWPVTFMLDTRSQILKVIGTETLPIQSRLAREEKRKRLNSRRQNPPQLPFREMPYASWQVPSVDLSLSVGRDERGTDSQFSLLGAGDLAFGSLDSFISGDSRGAIGSLRLTLGRESNEGGVFGYADLRSAKIGDVFVPTLNLISNPRYERGFQLSSFPLNYSAELGQIAIEGSGPPGVVVELFRGSELISFQTIGDDGRFAFLNVPLSMGQNSFRTLVYHADGQVDERQHEFRMDDYMLPAGKTAFQISATEAGFSTGHFFGIRNETKPFRHEISLFAAAEHGFSSLFSARFFFARVPDRQSLIEDSGSRSFLSFRPLFPSGFDGNLSRAESTFMNVYSGASGKFSIGKTYWKTDLVLDQENGRAYEISALTGFDNTTLSLAQAGFDGFMSAITELSGDILNLRRRARLNAKQRFFSFGDTDSDLILERRQGTIGYREDRVLWRLSQKIDRLRLTHFLEQNWITPPQQSTFQSRVGDLEAYSRRGLFDLTAGLSYELRDVPNLRALRALIGYDLDRNGRFDLGWQKDTQSQVDTFAAQISRKLKHYRAGFQMRWDRVNEFSGLATLTAGIAQDPVSREFFASGESVATVGLLAPEVTLERYDRDSGALVKEPLPEAEILIGGSPRNSDDDKVGRGVIRGLAPSQRIDVSVALSSLSDPFWRPPDEGYSFEPRRGVISQAKFSIIETGEIEGLVKVEEKNAGGVAFLLLDEAGRVIASRRTTSDGQIYFDALTPGRYVLKLDPQQDRRWRRLIPFEQVLEIKQENLTLFDLTIDLQQSTTQESPLPFR